MGVQNFWQLIESTGRPVNMNQGLEGKILAIDISIWLHQAAKGMRDRQNPHILLLLHRICKLLHFKIKPIFVFDGGVPELKRRTLAERKQRHDVAANKVKEANTKIRTNYLKMLAIQQLRGESIDSVTLPDVQENEKDLFELPDNHLRGQFDPIDNEETDDDEFIETNNFEPIRKMTRSTNHSTSDSATRTTANANYSYALPNVDDIDEDALNHLPKEMQYDILNEMKEKLKRGQRQRDELPQKSDDFSDYQVQKLLKQSSVSKKILTLNKAIKREKLDIPVESDARVYTGKLASDADTQYVLIKSDEQPVSLTQMSTPPPSFNRRSTSNFSADQMINRDPIAALTGQKKTPTTQIESKDFHQNRAESSTVDRLASETIVDVQCEEKTDVSPPSQTFSQQIETNDREYEDEDRALEIAIQRSLEDQKASTIETSDDSESDDSDFLPPVAIPTINEAAIVSMLFNVPVEKDVNASFESIETEPNHESTNSSVMIEDLENFIEEQHELSNVSESEKSASFSSQTERFDQLQTELMDDTAVQLNRARGNERLTATLTDTMHEDTKYLLRLFGIPYVISPSEAEAQCAFLNFSQQCDGVITDDSDVWLFGASKVYRHFFRQNQLVEFYDSTTIESQLGLDRESMIAIGMIVGSDYTKGIANAGIMTAIEILQEFHGNCMERLEKFRRWWKKAQTPNFSTQSKVLKRLKTLEIFQGFPNRAVYEAYTNPKIDDDQTKFSWAMPQLELIREFIGTKLKWDRQKIDEMILPVIKRWKSKEVQSRIDSFFAPLPFQGTSNEISRNKRLLSALDLLKQKTREAKENPQESFESNEDVQEGEASNVPAISSVVLKKRKRSNTTRMMENVLLMAERTKSSRQLRRKKKSEPIAAAVLSEDEES